MGIVMGKSSGDNECAGGSVKLRGLKPAASCIPDEVSYRLLLPTGDPRKGDPRAVPSKGLPRGEARSFASEGVESLFPFEKIRRGQSEFLQDAFVAMRDGKGLVAHAPTGIGKTAATVVPAIYEVLKSGGCAFFLTPKHSQHRIVIETIRRIRDKHGTRVVAIDFIGKKWLCPHPSATELSSEDFADYCTSVRKDETCPFHNNTVSKSKNAKLSRKAKTVLKGILERPPMHAEEIVEFCAGHDMCPFEMMTEAAKSAQVLVCDYYHIFSPQVRESFLFKTQKSLDDAILIVDEAQNMPSRLRALLSHRLSEFGLKRAAREARDFGFFDLADTFDGMRTAMHALAQAMVKRSHNHLGSGNAWQSLEFSTTREQLLEAMGLIPKERVNRFIEELEDLAKLARERQKKSSISGIARFLKAWTEGDDFGFVRSMNLATFKMRQYAFASYNCLDPAMAARPVFSEARSITLMSGTLTPTGMYSDILGLGTERETRQAVYSSPYNPANRLNVIDTSCTTKFAMRTPQEFERIGGKCGKMIAACPGSVAVFFPSYAMKTAIKPHVLEELSKSVLVLEEVQNMTKKEKTDLLRRLQNARKAVLLGVAAGSFSEGVDFPENILKCVIIVGLPLQAPSLEVRELIKYYDTLFNRGWDYGYVYPAMARAVQAAGRSIRSETDRAVIVFMDARYTWKNYRKCMPPELNITVTTDPVPLIKEFWKN